MHDRRGDVDLFGHELKITIQGITDEVAACANMIMGEANEGTPVAIIRGYTYLKDDKGIKVSYRPDETDLVRQALTEKIERDTSKAAAKNDKKIRSAS
jgi:coenzyme F420-0:L-glutamate ligase/coenzyme F420-1:gamma-L-glutamate ligase